MDIKSFKELPLMGILRGVSLTSIEPLLEEVIGAGLRTIEITMNTLGASEVIRKAASLSDGRIAVGAGTVLSLEDANSALEAGASFIVMPTLVKEVPELCKEKNVPFFPGAFTPQEVKNAWDSGASMVKVFPVGLFGPRYIKELKGPFDKMSLMAVGGVKKENIGEYFSCGADAVAFGGSVFKKEWLCKEDFTSIGKLTSEYVETVKEATE